MAIYDGGGSSKYSNETFKDRSAFFAIGLETGDQSAFFAIGLETGDQGAFFAIGLETGVHFLRMVGDRTDVCDVTKKQRFSYFKGARELKRPPPLCTFCDEDISGEYDGEREREKSKTLSCLVGSKPRPSTCDLCTGQTQGLTDVPGCLNNTSI